MKKKSKDFDLDLVELVKLKKLVSEYYWSVLFYRKRRTRSKYKRIPLGRVIRIRHELIRYDCD